VKKTIQKSRNSPNSCRLSGGGVGAEGMVIKRANWRENYKRSKIVSLVISIVLSLGHLGARL